jgi:hypothetical protein
MRARAFAHNFLETTGGAQDQANHYYSVEFSPSGVEIPYQFRLWNIASRPLCVVVREDSEIVSRLRVGEIFNMKYYSTDDVRPGEYLETAISEITRDDAGPFKGHYLVGLEIMPRTDGAKN